LSLGFPLVSMFECSAKKMLSTPVNFCLIRAFMICAFVKLFMLSFPGVVNEMPLPFVRNRSRSKYRQIRGRGRGRGYDWYQFIWLYFSR
jgi:hypothetical protein